MQATTVFRSLFLVWITLCSYSCLAQQSKDNASHEKAIKQYYEAYVKKDWHMLELILDEGFTFTSPAGDDHINLKLYKEKCWPNAENCKKLVIEKIVIDGDDAFVTYNG